MAAILLVDDDDVSRTIVRKMVERDGHCVVEAGNGAVALAALEAGLLPDCIVLDLMMPEVGGVDVLRRLRADSRWQNVPVMLMTSLDDGREVQEARAMGIGRHFVKAYWHSGDLLTAIGHVAGTGRTSPAAAATN